MPPLILAHRGFCHEYPENTLEAFEAAIKVGAQGFECDARLTRDGQVVIFHDETLQRMGHDPRFIQEMTLQQVQEIDMRHPQTKKKAKIPTLLEVCDFIKDRCLIDIELKEYTFFHRRLERAVLELVRTFKIRKQCIVSSFNPISLRYFSIHAPHIDRGFLFSEKQPLPVRRGALAPWTGVSTLIISRTLATPRAIDHFHKKGYKLMVWTVNDIEEARKLAQHKVHGLITDHPDKLIDGLKNI